MSSALKVVALVGSPTSSATSRTLLLVRHLLEELRGDGVAGKVLSIGPHSDLGIHDDYTLPVPALPDSWLAPVWLGFAQLFALQRSAALGLTPDNPFPDGTVNRVVQGVTIHSHG